MRPDVRRFRDEVLGGALLAPDEAVQLVTSPAAAVLAADHFGKGRVPLVGHDAKITGERAWREDEWQHRRIIVRVDPPGETISVEWSYDPQARPRRPVVQTLLYIDEEDYMDGVRVFRGSLLDGLRRLSETLAGRFPWHEAEASNFVLTGEHPEVPPLTGEVRDGTIRLTVEPFVSAGTVRNFYRQMEIRAGGDAKQDTAKAAAVLRFVLSQVDDKGNRPSWPELQDRWNASHPEWQYMDRGSLRKTFRRAYRRIVDPVRSASDPQFS
jgi:hypothetical protein